jgi:hypothetical protein
LESSLGAWAIGLAQGVDRTCEDGLGKAPEALGGRAPGGRELRDQSEKESRKGAPIVGGIGGRHTESCQQWTKCSLSNIHIIDLNGCDEALDGGLARDPGESVDSEHLLDESHARQGSDQRFQRINIGEEAGPRPKHGVMAGWVGREWSIAKRRPSVGELGEDEALQGQRIAALGGRQEQRGDRLLFGAG